MHDEKDLKRIVFKACAAAAWADARLSVDERRLLSHLTATLADGPEEAEEFGKIRLQEVNEGRVLAEVGALDAAEKHYVFDTCLDILAADRILAPLEMKFVHALRKACGVGYWPFRKKLNKVRIKAKAWILPDPRQLVFLTLILALILLIVSPTHHADRRSVEPLKEKNSGREVVVSILSSKEAAKLPKETAEAVYKKVEDSAVTVTVLIDNNPAYGGSGAIIGLDDAGTAYIVTNRHVVRNSENENRRPGAQRIEVKQPSGARFDATLDFYSRRRDLALLAVKGIGRYAKPLKLSLKADRRVGEAVFVMGSPLSYEHTFTAGLVSAIRDDYLQTDATTSHGSSGGPILDRHGALCAVETRGHETKNFSFAIYADAILDMLKERSGRLKKR